MMPEGPRSAEWRRAALASGAFGVTALIIYGLFSSGFGRPTPTVAASPTPVPAVEPVPATGGPGRPAVGRPGGVAAPKATLAVVAGDFWLTYLPAGLRRTGGGAIPPGPGVEGAWARFGSAGRYVEAQVERGTVAADWESYRERVSLADARGTTIRGRPAMVGRPPSGGRMIVWLERVGTGAWIRVSESLGRELLPLAASVRAPVGD
ncbi:hypothetical protein [Nonomuraea cavernae]|uniref:DUF4245 domain-containing protein n=1 Tax=Nonomuraea cavernae TaxID=2045107 RepID=A0A918DIH3_9ACTN|nr:hypothetical protein [Nonomuraea cavernae]MCA2187227.1 hypothetical protein [Nonomuraea cavernae]GGO67968.1 hypothetical protein GCM10012289_25640 [Nonomuraea cavernae]